MTPNSMTPRNAALTILAGLLLAFLPFALTQLGVGPGDSAAWITLFTVPIAGAMILGGLFGLMLKLVTLVFSQNH